MKKIYFKILIVAFSASLMTACNTDPDQGHDNSGNSAEYPPQPSDSEYPGSKQHDSVNNVKDTTEANQHNK